MSVFITAFGFARPEGVGKAGGKIAASPAVGFNIGWGEISQRPFDRFGRLDPISKFALTAIEMLELPEPAVDRDDWGIVLSTRYGSSGADAEFIPTIDSPGGASPLIFSYTLPSTLIGEAAMRHRLTGENLCISTGPQSRDAALWEAVNFVATGAVEKCIAVAADAPGPLSPDEAPFALAFLVESTARPDGTALARIRFSRKGASHEAICGIMALSQILEAGRSADVLIEYPYANNFSERLIIEAN